MTISPPVNRGTFAGAELLLFDTLKSAARGKEFDPRLVELYQ